MHETSSNIHSALELCSYVTATTDHQKRTKAVKMYMKQVLCSMPFWCSIAFFVNLLTLFELVF